MKHLKFLLILSLTITLFSCGSDDDGVAAPVSPNADLLGTWSGTSITGSITGTITDTSDNSSTPYSGTISGTNLSYTVTFTETPNLVTSQGTFGSEIVLMQGGQTITIGEAGNAFLDTSNATWTRNGSTLIITDGGEVTSSSLAINGNTMTLSTSEMSSEVDGTQTTTATANAVFTFTKQ
jgi:hypothetical protein